MVSFLRPVVGKSWRSVRTAFFCRTNRLTQPSSAIHCIRHDDHRDRRPTRQTCWMFVQNPSLRIGFAMRYSS